MVITKIENTTEDPDREKTSHVLLGDFVLGYADDPTV
jgi:hypothetical protein